MMLLLFYSVVNKQQLFDAAQLKVYIDSQWSSQGHHSAFTHTHRVIITGLHLGAGSHSVHTLTALLMVESHTHSDPPSEAENGFWNIAAL